MTRKNLILLITATPNWNIFKASIHSVAEEGSSLLITGGLPEGVSELSDDKLYFLQRYCNSLDSLQLYKDFGQLRFKTQENFWKKADKNLMVYVQRIAGQRLMKCIIRAGKCGLPVYLSEKKNKSLEKTQQMTLAEKTDVMPIMRFSKSEKGIEYELSLSVNGSVIEPYAHKIHVLSNSPAVFIIDNMIHLVPKGLNAKILAPFLNGKKQVSIPERMQEEYLRKFVMPNASKCEIITEGIDVKNIDIEPTCMICVQPTVMGWVQLEMKFKYGDKITFAPDDRRRAAAMLLDIDGRVAIRRVVRNETREEDICKWFAKYTENLMSHTITGNDTTIKFANLAEAIMWLNENSEKLTSDNCISEIVLYTSQQYYIRKYSVAKSRTWIGDWLNIKITLTLSDGTNVPFSYFREAIISGQEEIQLPNGEIFIIPREWFEKYSGLLMFSSPNGDYLRIHKCQLGAVNPDIYDASSDDEAPKILQTSQNTPSGFQATLREYQKSGVKWLIGNLQSNTGCCLADDMGLGKTVQTIALLLKYKECDVASPMAAASSLSAAKGGKKKEKAVFTGDLFSDLFDDDTSKNQNTGFKTSLIVCPTSLIYNWQNELKRFAPSLSVCSYVGTVDERKKKKDNLCLWDVVLTTYRTVTNDIDKLSSLSFGVIVFDESQMFKNRSSQLHAAIKLLKANFRIALSGTPMENSLSELWSLMSVINGNLLGDFKTFQKNFATPISENLEDTRTKILSNIIAPYFLRRTKEQVLTDLPERQDKLIVCEMNESQQSMYEEELSKARNLVSTSTSDEFSVLAAIGRLRQIANHPSLLGLAEDDVNLSGKTSAVFEHLEALYGTNHKVLLFSEYVSFLTLIAKDFKRRGWKYEMLTGETQNREQVIQRFNQNQDCQFFLVSLKAGGVGLNLTSADYVFLLNPWWNKAAEEQAISRAHRIGQRRSVFVYRFVSGQTLEEKILKLQDYKETLIDTVMPFLK